MKTISTRGVGLAAIILGSAFTVLGQTTIYEQSRFGPNNASGSNNSDFTFGSGINATLSSIKSTAPGLPGGSSSCRFFGTPASANDNFTVSPSGANQLTVGTTYAIATTFGNNTTSGQGEDTTIVVNNTDTGTTGLDTFAGLSTAFQKGNGVNTWETIGYVTINSSTPTFTFTWSSGFSANRWYVDTVRFIPLGTQGTPEYWDTGSIGGSGSWDTVTQNWNPNANGSGTQTTYSSSGLAIFGGTAGTVSIAAGGITASGGVEFDVNGYTLQGGALTLGAAAPYIWITNGNTVTINSTISGANGILLPASGTVAVSTPITTSSLTGTVNIGAGTLNLTSTSSQSFSSLAGAGTLQLAATTLTVGSDNLNTVFAGQINDQGAGAAFVKTGTGTLALTASNYFAGPLTIDEGTLTVPSSNALGAIPASFNAGQVVLNGNGATLFSSASSLFVFQANQGITVNGSNVIAANASAREITFNCPITGNGSVTMPGVWPDFNVANTFTGDLIFQLTNNVSARFNANNSAGMGTIHIMPMTASGTPCTIRNFAPTGASTTITNNIFYDESVAHAQNYNIDTAGSSGAFILTGNISGTATGGVNLGDNVNGGGLITLSGDNSAYAGGFNLEGGTLNLGSSTALGSGWFVINHAGFSTQILEASLALTGASAITNTVYLNTASGFNVSGGNPIEFSGPFNLGTGSSDAITVNNGETIISGNITDGGTGSSLSLNSQNTSTLLLKGSNSVAGGFYVNSGILEATNINSLQGNVTVGSAGILQIDTTNAMSPSSSLIVNSGGNVFLTFTGSMTNASLNIGGTIQPYGVYGQNANNPNSVFYGPGTLVVSPNFAITSETPGTNGLTVCWQSTVGYNYDVLTNIGVAGLPGSWTPINGSPIIASNTTTCFTLPGVTGNPQVFVVIRANNVTP